MFTKAHSPVLTLLLASGLGLVPACAASDDPATANELGANTASGNPSSPSTTNDTVKPPSGPATIPTTGGPDAIDTSPTTADPDQTAMGGAAATPDSTNVATGGTGGLTGAGGAGTVSSGGMGTTDDMTGGMGGGMGMAGSSNPPDDMGMAGSSNPPDDMNAGGSGNQGEANASPGCGNSGRPGDGTVYVAGESWLVFPESYDGNTPFPVLWGFHGCGSGNRGDASRTEYTDATRNTAFESEYVVAIPLSSDAAGCWNYNTDINRVKALYDELVNNYCVDIDRMFATGHSSGAYFSVALLEAGHTADAAHMNFRGMAPVAASPVNNHSTPMPVLYMENPNDSERSDNNAPTVVGGFRSANGCAETSQPYDGAEACNSSSGGAQVNAGCISYDGCDQPTVWCSHNDQSYGTTGHGIPCFAAQAMDDFFKSL